MATIMYKKQQEIRKHHTTLALIFDISNHTFLLPIEGRRSIGIATVVVPLTTQSDPSLSLLLLSHTKLAQILLLELLIAQIRQIVHPYRMIISIRVPPPIHKLVVLHEILESTSSIRWLGVDLLVHLHPFFKELS